MNKQEHILRKNQRMNVHPQLRAAWLLIPCVKVTLTETSTKALVRFEYLYLEVILAMVLSHLKLSCLSFFPVSLLSVKRTGVSVKCTNNDVYHR